MNLKREFMLVQIAIFIYDRGKRTFSVNELAHFMKINRNHPYLSEILNILKEKEIILKSGEYGLLNLYIGDKKKIRDFVDELPSILTINEEYNSRYHIRPY